MYSLDAILWDEIQRAANAKHPVTTYEDMRVRDKYALRLYDNIARALVREAMRECGDCYLCGRPFNGAPMCESCREAAVQAHRVRREASHAVEEG